MKPYTLKVSEYSIRELRYKTADLLRLQHKHTKAQDFLNLTEFIEDRKEIIRIGKTFNINYI